NACIFKTVFEILFGGYATPTKCVAFWRLALNSYENFHKREAEERRNAGYDRTKIVMQIIKSNVRRKV
ncbi:MAG: hypothetical protein EGR84_02515, partial [Coprococcus catus]|nr:hypothetical protein [Coprococcus catus]